MTHPTPLADAQRNKGPAPLTLSKVNPLEHADAIKEMFVTHERPEFPGFFDRAYPEAVAEGANGWVGRDPAGRICGFVAQFPRRFGFGDQVVRGALLGNLMVATAYRTFFPGVSLMRRAVTDLRESGTADFVYGDPNELARPVAEAAGLREVGALRRFVLPLTDRRAAIGLGIRVYRAVKGWQTRAVPLVATERRPGDEPSPENLLPLGDPQSLRPLRTTSIYRGRLAGYPAPGDRWFAFYQKDSPGALVGRALVRGPDAQGVATLCVWECEPLARLSAQLLALGNQLRERGAERLEVYVMAASRAERKFRRAAFLSREELVPVIARPFTTLGTAVVEAAVAWRILPVDLDR